MNEEVVKLDIEKLKAVVLYICGRLEAAQLGKVKLHKILYFTDMLWYSETGEPMTGAHYQKQQFGPMARELKQALGQLELSGSLTQLKRKFYGFEKTDFVVKEAGSAPTNRLSKDEYALIDIVTDFVCEKSAKEISEISHNAAWHAAALGEDLPYFSVYGWAGGEVTDEDLSQAAAVARTLPPREQLTWYE